ncbi:MAG: adenylyltransferase/cytidyltransferase family protein [Nanoarchaeota archaeon]|nr:adenylyltransferase/cytidyltransferase family protein [Nanoarchaeota archaeon]
MSEEEKVVVVSGYFDPLHVGHIEYMKMSKELGHKLIVIVNNDVQAHLKKGFNFMHEEDRVKIIRELGFVDEVFLSIDKDCSVCESLRAINPHIFANGGDRHQGEVPEAVVCRELGIAMMDGMGEKIRSSSELVEEAKKKEIKKALEEY